MSSVSVEARCQNHCPKKIPGLTSVQNQRGSRIRVRSSRGRRNNKESENPTYQHAHATGIERDQ